MKNLLILALFSLVVSACEKKIPFEGEDESNKLVINCFIGPNLNEVVAHVSSSQSVLSTNEITFLSNATVKLYKNGTLLGTMNSDGGGKYMLAHTPEIGATYRIEASNIGFSSISAETYIPATPNISSISTPTMDDEETLFNVIVNDAGSQDNWYQLLLIQTDQFGTNPFVISFNCNSPLLPRNSSIGDENSYYSTDAFFTDNAFNGGSTNFQIRAYIGGPEATVQYLNCTEDYYLYKKTLFQYYEVNGNPFSQPVQVYSNVEGGLGIFAGYAFDQESIPF